MAGSLDPDFIVLPAPPEAVTFEWRIAEGMVSIMQGDQKVTMPAGYFWNAVRYFEDDTVPRAAAA